MGRIIKRIYLSGAISNDPDYLMKFKSHELKLLNKFERCFVFNPAEWGLECIDRGLIDLENGDLKAWHDFMIQDLYMMKDCTHIYFIPEKNESIGREIEKLWAKKLCLEIINEI